MFVYLNFLCVYKVAKVSSIAKTQLLPSNYVNTI